MPSIANHLKRIRREAVQNDLITLAWAAYAFILLILFITIGVEAVFYLSSAIRLITLKIIAGLIVAGTVSLFIVNALIEQNKIKRYSWSKLARAAGKLAFPKSDVVINAYQLEQSENSYTSNSLSKSYIQRISNKLKRINLKKLFPAKRADNWKVFSLSILFLGSLMVIIFWDSSSNALTRWGHPKHEFEVPKPFSITGITRNIHLLGGDSTPLSFEISGLLPDSIFLELIPSTKDTALLLAVKPDTNGRYTHLMEEVYQDYRYRAFSPANHFWQAWKKVVSPDYYISVTDRPIMEEFSITVIPPDYSGLPANIQKGNQADVKGLKGSTVRIDLKSNRPLNKGFLKLDNEKIPLTIRGKRAAGGFIFNRDALLKIELEDNRGITNQNPIPFHLQILPDLNPEMSVIQPAPIVELGTDQLIPIHLKIEDDFGFSTLQVGYEIKRPSYIEDESLISIFPISIENSTDLSQEVKTIWNLVELGLMPEDEVHYHFEVYDNDEVSGPKKSISSTFIARVPSLGDLFTAMEEKEDQVIDELIMHSKEIEGIQEQLENMKLEMLKSDSLDWDQQQQMEETLAQVQQEADALKKLAESMEAINQSAEKNSLFSDDLMRKFKELQELVNEILNPELMTDLNAFQDALEKMDMKDIMDAMEKLSSNLDQVEQQLDRFLDIFRRIKAEQKLDEIIQRMNQLVEQQRIVNENIQTLDEQTDPATIARLSHEEQRNSEEFSNIRDVMEEAAEAMQEFDLESAAALENLEKDHLTNQTESSLSQTARQLQKQRIQQAQQKSAESLENLENLQFMLADIQSQFQDQTTKEMAGKFQTVMRDLLELSKLQESLEQNTRTMPKNSQRLAAMAGQQQFAQDQLMKIMSSLMDLSKETFAVTPQMGKGIGMANAQMEEAKKKLTKRNGRGAANSQQSAMTSLNEAVLAVYQAMNKMQASGSASGYEQFLQRMQEISGRQQGINDQSMQLAFGQLFAAAQRSLMQRLLKQQRQVQKSLQQLMSETRQSGEQGLGDLGGIAEDIDEVIKDFQNKRYQQRTKQRQQRILSRMLDSQKSLTQRGFKEERKAEPANAIVYEGPSGLPVDYGQRRSLAMEALNQSLKAGYSRDYQTMIRRYFNALIQSGEQIIPTDTTFNE